MNWKNAIRKFRKNGSYFRNLASGIATLITILSGIFAVIAYFFSDIKSITWLSTLLQNSLVIKIFIVSFLVSDILLVFVVRHYYIDGKERLEKFTYGYRIATERYRDLIYKLQLKKRRLYS